MKLFSRVVVSAAVVLLVAPPSFAVSVGERGCIEGFVMDYYCLELGYLLDNPTVDPLEGPDRHSVHCLIEVSSCVNSRFEILGDPVQGQTTTTTTYTRDWALDDTTKETVIDLAKQYGRCPVVCTGSGTISRGFRVRMTATVVALATSSSPPLVTAESDAIQVIDITDPNYNAAAQGCSNNNSGNGPDNDALQGEKTPAGLIDPAAAFRRNALIHGSLMLISWGWMLPTGAVVARFLRHRNPLWFQLHATLQPIGLILAIVGWSWALVHFNALSAKGEANYRHAVMGMTVMVLGLLQPINAVLRPHASTEPNSKLRRWWWEILHKSLGYVSLLLAVPTIVLGTKRLPNANDQRTFQIVYGAAAVGLVVLTAVVLRRDKVWYKKPVNEEAPVKTCEKEDEPFTP